jgi:hypothetical protein
VFRYGDVVICDVRDQVEIVGLSGGRIPWPVRAIEQTRKSLLPQHFRLGFLRFDSSSPCLPEGTGALASCGEHLLQFKK